MILPDSAESSDPDQIDLLAFFLRRILICPHKTRPALPARLQASVLASILRSIACIFIYKTAGAVDRRRRLEAETRKLPIRVVAFDRA